ncbi:hypothetical protein RJ55_06420 [Drechmeria coniospora]|nr:hypothetical protein RJ55_06420 [Drechmeria coniospora]
MTKSTCRPSKVGAGLAMLPASSTLSSTNRWVAKGTTRRSLGPGRDGAKQQPAEEEDGQTRTAKKMSSVAMTSPAKKAATGASSNFAIDKYVECTGGPWHPPNLVPVEKKPTESKGGGGGGGGKERLDGPSTKATQGSVKKS